MRRLRSLTFDHDPELGPKPRILPLADDARALFEDIRHDVTIEVQATTGLRAHWHGKNPARALRLALVSNFFSWTARRGGQPEAVTGKSMRCARAYLDYADKMLDRVVVGLPIGEDVRDAARIARFLLAQPATALNERLLYQTAGFRALRDRQRRAAAFRPLVRFLKRVVVPEAEGRPRTWPVNPKLYEKTAP